MGNAQTVISVTPNYEYTVVLMNTMSRESFKFTFETGKNPELATIHRIFEIMTNAATNSRLQMRFDLTSQLVGGRLRLDNEGISRINYVAKLAETYAKSLTTPLPVRRIKISVTLNADDASIRVICNAIHEVFHAFKIIPSVEPSTSNPPLVVTTMKSLTAESESEFEAEEKAAFASRELSKLFAKNAVRGARKVLIASGVMHPHLATITHIVDTEQKTIATGPRIEGCLLQGSVLCADGAMFFTGHGQDNYDSSAKACYRYNPVSQEVTQLPDAKLKDATVMALLPDERVLMTYDRTGELYDVRTGTSQYCRRVMTDRRENHAACTLNDGRVFLVGGEKQHTFDFPEVQGTSEFYDLRTSNFSRGPDTPLVHCIHLSATTLSSGDVIIRHPEENFYTIYDVRKNAFRNTVFNEFEDDKFFNFEFDATHSCLISSRTLLTVATTPQNMVKFEYVDIDTTEVKRGPQYAIDNVTTICGFDLAPAVTPDVKKLDLSKVNLSQLLGNLQV